MARARSGAAARDHTPESTTVYYRLPGGGLAVYTADPPSGLVPPPGAVEITAEEYEAEQQRIEDAERQAREQAEAEAAARAAAVYRELLDAGMSEEVARSISGYTGPADPAEPAE